MPGSSTTPGRTGARVHAPVRVAFRFRNGVGTRDMNLYEAQWLAYVLPYRRFAAALTDDNARLGANVDRYSFIASDLHRLLVAGLPAHCERFWTLPKLGFVKVAKYYYYPGWWEGTGQGHNIINKESWNGLPKHYQAAITTASHDAFTWVTGKYDYVNPPALKRLVAAGAILRPFPQEVLEGCYNAANEIYADLSKSNKHFGKMYSSLAAYRSESLAWMQVAELSFDSFMMRMRTRT